MNAHTSFMRAPDDSSRFCCVGTLKPSPCNRPVMKILYSLWLQLEHNFLSREVYAKFLGGTANAAMGRSPLLSSQSHQPILASIKRHQLSRRLRVDVHGSRRGGLDRLAGCAGQAAGTPP